MIKCRLDLSFLVFCTSLLLPIALAGAFLFPNHAARQPAPLSLASNPRQRGPLYFLNNPSRRKSSTLFDSFEGDSDLSTSDLLAELDRKNIRYHPTASREELEQLLASGGASSADGPKPDIAHIVKELVSAGIRLPPHASRAELERLHEDYRQGKLPERSKKRRKHKALPRLLRDLDDLGIWYPPGASPATLERLLREHQKAEPPRIAKPNRDQRNIPRREDQPSSGLYNKTPSMSTSELLAALVERGIRFQPTATRSELEQLLRDNNRPVSNPSKGFSSRDSFTTTAPKQQYQEPTGTYEKETARRQKLKERSTPRANDEMNQWWMDSDTKNGSPRATVENNDRNQRHRSKQRMQSKRQSSGSRLYGNSKRTFRAGLFDTIPEYLYSTSDTAKNRLSRVTERAARKARYYTRNVKEFFKEDEHGIRDADYFYVNKNIPIDVPAEPILSDNTQSTTAYTTSRRRQAPYSNSNGGKYTSYRRTEGGFDAPSQPRHRKVHRNPRSTAHQAATRYQRTSQSLIRSNATSTHPQIDSAVRSALFQLPPADLVPRKGTSVQNNSSQAASSQKQKQAKKKPNEKRRRIYSPYVQDGPPSEAYRDSLDRFGEFVANATENILWGKLDNEEEHRKSEEDVLLKAKKKRNHRAREDASYVRSKGSWKDRLEERFDAMLGIHEDGEYYSRWTREEEAEKMDEGGNDAFSVAQGRAPKASHRRKKKVYDKSFWEENNLISSLFGKSPPAGYSRIFDGGYLLPLCKTLIKSFIVLATNACQWATVRGSLPQPVVVVGVTSCVVSARPGKRLLTLAVVLGIFRIVGELVHEAAHGSEDWDDDQDYDQADEGDMYDGADL